MRKYTIPILGFAIIILLVVSMNFVDIKYLFNIDNQYDVIPEAILQKHHATIQKIDNLIEDNNLGGMTSQSKNFNFDYYSQIIKVGIITYVAQNDPFNKELQEFVADIDQYLIDIRKLEKDNKDIYGDETPVPTTL